MCNPASSDKNLNEMSKPANAVLVDVVSCRISVAQASQAKSGFCPVSVNENRRIFIV